MKPYYSPESTDVILDCIADGVFAVDLDWRITAFNQAAERKTGVAQADAQGQRKSITISTALLKDKGGLFQELITNTKVYVQQDLFRMLDVPGDAIQRIRHFIRSIPDLLEEYATFVKVHASEFGRKGYKVEQLFLDGLFAV